MTVQELVWLTGPKLASISIAMISKEFSQTLFGQTLADRVLTGRSFGLALADRVLTVRSFGLALFSLAALLGQ